MNFLSFIIAFFTARAFAPLLADFLYNSYIKPNIASGASNQIESFLTPNIDLNALAYTANPPENFVNMLRGYGFDLTDFQTWLREAGPRGAEGAREFIAYNLATPVARQFSYFLAFVLILVAILILLKIAVNIIDSLVSLPGLNFMNKSGGILLGLVYGLTVSYIFVFLATFFMPYLEANSVIGSWADIRDGTVFFRWLYENSPIESILGWF